MKMISIKTLILGASFLFVTLLVSAQPSEPEKPIYSQKVGRFHTILNPFSFRQGILYLNESDIMFSPRNEKEVDSFVLDYGNIRSVKRGFLFIWPNKIVITDKNFSKFKIQVYKRRKIVEIIESKIGTTE